MTEASGAPISLDMPAAPLEAILAYIYEGCCPLGHDSVLPLLEAAVYLQIEPLEAALAESATARMAPTDCVSLLKLARTRSLPKLEEAVWRKMPKLIEFGIGRVMRSGEYASLPDADVARIIELAEVHCEVRREIRLVGIPPGRSAQRKGTLARGIFERLAPAGFDFECTGIERDAIVRFEVPLELLMSFSGRARFYDGRKTDITEAKGWLADGFPKQLSLGGLPFEHYRFEIDRGMS